MAVMHIPADTVGRAPIRHTSASPTIPQTVQWDSVESAVRIQQPIPRQFDMGSIGERTRKLQFEQRCRLIPLGPIFIAQY